MKETIAENLKNYLVGEELDDAVLSRLADRAIGIYKSYVNYPASVAETDINADLEKHIECLTDLALNAWAKQGAEFETQHSENGVNRSWSSETSIFSMYGIVPYAEVM